MKSKFNFIFFVNILLVSITSFSQTAPSNCVDSISHGPFNISLDQSKTDDGEFLVQIKDGTSFKGKFFKNQNKQSIACFYEFKKSTAPKYRLHRPIYPEEGCDSNIVNYLTAEDYTKSCSKDASNCWAKTESVSIISGIGLLFKSKTQGEHVIKRETLKQLKSDCSNKQTQSKSSTANPVTPNKQK